MAGGGDDLSHSRDCHAWNGHVNGSREQPILSRRLESHPWYLWSGYAGAGWTSCTWRWRSCASPSTTAPPSPCGTTALRRASTSVSTSSRVSRAPSSAWLCTTPKQATSPNRPNCWPASRPTWTSCRQSKTTVTPRWLASDSVVGHQFIRYVGGFPIIRAGFFYRVDCLISFFQSKMAWYLSGSVWTISWLMWLLFGSLLFRLIFQYQNCMFKGLISFAKENNFLCFHRMMLFA